MSIVESLGKEAREHVLCVSCFCVSTKIAVIIRMAERRKMLGTNSKHAEIEAQMKSRDFKTKAWKQYSEYRWYVSRGLWLAAIFAGVFFLYFQNIGQNASILARHNETIVNRVDHVPCSDKEYPKDALKFGVCVPTQCKRIIKDDIIPESDVDYLKGLADRIFEYGQSQIKVSFVSLHTGKIYKINKYKDLYKLPDAKQLFSERDFDTYGRISDLLKEQVSLEFGVPLDKLYVSNYTFLSRMDNEKPINITVFTDVHIDKEGAPSFYTALLYMNTYKEDFDGGRLIFLDEFRNQTIEPRKGRVVLFTAGSENTHKIEDLSSGFRTTYAMQFACEKRFGYSNPSLKNFTV